MERLPESMLGLAAERVQSIESALAHATQAIELGFADIELDYGEVNEATEERLREIAERLVSITGICEGLLETIQTDEDQEPDEDHAHAIAGASTKTRSSGRSLAPTPGPSESTTRRKPRADRGKRRGPRQPAAPDSLDNTAKEKPKDIERNIPSSEQLYAKLVSTDLIPTAGKKIDPDKPTVHLEIQGDKVISINGRRVELNSHNLYLFNILLTHRDRPVLSGVFHKYGYHPDAKPATRKTSLAANLRKMTDRVNNDEDAVVLRNTKNSKKHMYLMNPQVVITDTRDQPVEDDDTEVVVPDKPPADIDIKPKGRKRQDKGDEEKSIFEQVENEAEDEKEEGTALQRLAVLYQDDKYVKRQVQRYKRRNSKATQNPATDPEARYLQEIGQYDLLTKEQEIELANAVSAGRQAFLELEADISKFTSNPELEQLVREAAVARQILILSNTRLVVSRAKRHSYMPKMGLIDRIQEGNLGLMRAIETYDVEKGFRFTTYATQWIDQHITRAMADKGRTVRIPVHMHEQMGKISQIRKKLNIELGEDPTNEQIAEASKGKFTAEQVAKIAAYNRVEPRSIHAGYSSNSSHTSSDGETDPVENMIAGNDHQEMEDHVKWLDDRKDLEGMIAQSGLSQRDKFVLSVRYGVVLRELQGYTVEVNGVEVRYEDAISLAFFGGKGLTLEKTSSFLGLTRERVRQVEAKALSRINW